MLYSTVFLYHQKLFNFRLERKPIYEKILENCKNCLDWTLSQSQAKWGPNAPKNWGRRGIKSAQQSQWKGSRRFLMKLYERCFSLPKKTRVVKIRARLPRIKIDKLVFNQLPNISETFFLFSICVNNIVEPNWHCEKPIGILPFIKCHWTKYNWGGDRLNKTRLVQDVLPQT